MRQHVVVWNGLVSRTTPTGEERDVSDLRAPDPVGDGTTGEEGVHQPVRRLASPSEELMRGSLQRFL